MRSDFDETNGASAAGDSTFAPFIENTNPSMSTGSLNIVMPDKNKDTRMSPNPNRGKKIVGAIVGTCAVAAIVGCGFAYANGLFGQQAQPAARPTVTTTTVQEAKHETAPEPEPEPAPIAQSGMITITLRAEGLTGEGSRIPLHVKGVRLDAVPYTQDIFASAGESKLNLPAGSYSLSVVGSPISAEGVVYSIPTEAIQVDISEDGTVTCDPMDTHFELKPVEAADVTDAQIEEARSWVAKDPDNASKAEKLANLAQQRRKNASISGSQSNSRDTDHASESHEATQNDNSNYTATDSTESNSPSYYVPTQTYESPSSETSSQESDSSSSSQSETSTKQSSSSSETSDGSSSSSDSGSSESSSSTSSSSETSDGFSSSSDSGSSESSSSASSSSEGVSTSSSDSSASAV